MKNNKTGDISTLKASLEMSKQKIEFLTQMNDLDRSEIKFVFSWLVLPKLIVLTYCTTMIILANSFNDKISLAIIAGFLIIITQRHLNRMSELHHEIRLRKLKIANEVEKQDKILADIHKIKQQMQAGVADG